MSLISFNQQCAETSRVINQTARDVAILKDQVNGVKGPFDQLLAEADRVGSACADVGGAIVEAVRLSGEAVPTLQGVAWELYQTTQKIEETTKVSRDVLDQIASVMDKSVPQYELWTKHWLALAEQGKLSLKDLEKTIEDWFGSVGIQQLNTVMHGDIPNFILAFRRLMKEIDGAAGTPKGDKKK